MSGNLGTIAASYVPDALSKSEVSQYLSLGGNPGVRKDATCCAGVAPSNSERLINESCLARLLRLCQITAKQRPLAPLEPNVEA